jgi:hypothetical protein
MDGFPLTVFWNSLHRDENQKKKKNMIFRFTLNQLHIAIYKMSQGCPTFYRYTKFSPIIQIATQFQIPYRISR